MAAAALEIKSTASVTSSSPRPPNARKMSAAHSMDVAAESRLQNWMFTSPRVIHEWTFDAATTGAALMTNAAKGPQPVASLAQLRSFWHWIARDRQLRTARAFRRRVTKSGCG